MSRQLLAVKWTYEDEYIPLPNSNASGDQLATRSRFRGRGWRGIAVTYVTRVVQFQKAKDKNTLVLRYELSNQNDQFVTENAEEIDWGTYTYHWSTSTRIGSAHFEGDEMDATVELLGGEDPVKELRPSKSVMVKLRPEQRALRDKLLCLDKGCVLTGEQEEAAVEAAHIVPVDAGGREVISNAFLLRADLPSPVRFWPVLV